MLCATREKYSVSTLLMASWNWCRIYFLQGTENFALKKVHSKTDVGPINDVLLDGKLCTLD